QGSAGALPNAASILLNRGSCLSLDSPSGNSNNRVRDAAAVTLSSATLSLAGRSGAATSETMGGLTFRSGDSLVRVDTARAGATTGTATLTFGSLGARQAGATAN